MESPPPDLASYALCGLAVLCGVALATAGWLEGYPYWGDEGYSVAAASNPFGESLRRYVLPDRHPPLYYLLLSAWFGVFGDGEVAARSLSYVAALGALGLLWVMSRGSALALSVATAWLATHWLWVVSAQEARMYALVVIGATWLSLAFVPLWSAAAPPSRRSMAFFSCGALLLAGLHYYAMALSCTALLLLCWKARRDPVAVAMPAVVFCTCVSWLALHVLYSETFPSEAALWQGLRANFFNVVRVSVGYLGFVFPQLHWLLIQDEILRLSLKLSALLATTVLGAIAWGRARVPKCVASAKLLPRQGEELDTLKSLALLVGAVLLALLASTAIRPLPHTKGVAVLLPAIALMLGILVRHLRSGGWRLIIIASLLGSSLGVAGQWKSEDRLDFTRWLRPPALRKHEYPLAEQRRDRMAAGANLYAFAGEDKVLPWEGVFGIYANDSVWSMKLMQDRDAAHLVPPYFGLVLPRRGPAPEHNLSRRGITLKRSYLTDAPARHEVAIFLVTSAGHVPDS